MRFSSEPARYSGGNGLLDGLADADTSVIYPLVSVYLDSDPYVLQTRELAIEAVYFPLDAVYSIVVELDRGVAFEVDTVGRTGAINLELLLDAEVAPRTILCQMSGKVGELSRSDFMLALEASPNFKSACLKALRRQTFISQQGVACNAAHNHEQRCARWILMSGDQVGRLRFLLRLEYLGVMLGLTISDARAALRLLEDADAVHFHDEMVTIISRETLRARSCECYAAQNITTFVDLAFLPKSQTRLDDGNARAIGDGFLT